MEFLAVIDRWLHILAGIMWVGLLYYFNFVQAPAMAQAAADKDGPGPTAILKYIAPRALLWFRWAALVTWLTGALYLVMSPTYTFWGAITLGAASGQAADTIIGFGAWMGTIMLFNVWVLIWPSQKKILGLVPATEAERDQARHTAFITLRVNVVLSIPLVLFMMGTFHGLMF